MSYTTDSNKYRVSCSQKSFNFHRSMGVRRSTWVMSVNLQGNSTGNSSFQPLQVFLMYILTLSHPVLS